MYINKHHLKLLEDVYYDILAFELVRGRDEDNKELILRYKELLKQLKDQKNKNKRRNDNE